MRAPYTVGVFAGSPIGPRWPRSQNRSPQERAAGEENFGPARPKSTKIDPEARNHRDRRRPSLARTRRCSSASPAASCCSCCLGCCCHLGSSHAAVHLARTTVHQLQESGSDALVKVFAVRLAVLLVTLGASAPPSAAERRLMVWPPGRWRRLGRTAACSPKVRQELSSRPTWHDFVYVTMVPLDRGGSIVPHPASPHSQVAPLQLPHARRA